MVKYSVSADLRMPAAQYFAERDSAAFRALMCKALNLSHMEFVDVSVDEAGFEIVKLITKPDLEAYVPKSLQRYLSFEVDFFDYLAYTHTQGPSYSLQVTSAPGFMKEGQYDIKGTLTISPLEGQQGACRQTLEGEATIRILGLGKTAEKIIVNSLKQTYDSLPAVVERWVEFRQQAAANGSVDELLGGRPDIKAFPTAALDVLKRPYDDPVAGDTDVEAPPPAEAADAAAQELMGKLQVGDDVFYDAAEVLSVDPGLDPAASRVVLGDKKAAMEEIMASRQAVQLDLEVEAPSQPQATKAGGRASRFFKEGYNDSVAAWAKFWDDVGVAKTKVPNMAQRFAYLGDTAEKMGMLKITTKNVPSRGFKVPKPIKALGDGIEKGAKGLGQGVTKGVKAVVTAPKTIANSFSAGGPGPGLSTLRSSASGAGTSGAGTGSARRGRDVQ